MNTNAAAPAVAAVQRKPDRESDHTNAPYRKNLDSKDGTAIQIEPSISPQNGIQSNGRATARNWNGCRASTKIAAANAAATIGCRRLSAYSHAAQIAAAAKPPMTS